MVPRRHLLAAWMTVCVAAAIAACEPTGPRSLDEAIQAALPSLRLSPATEVLRREEDDHVLVVFLGRAGVPDAAGILVVDRTAPWTIRGRGSGAVARSDPASVLLSLSSSAGESSLLAYGPVTDVRIRQLELEGPGGPILVEASPPAFATMIPGVSRLPVSWRFLDAAGNVVYDPFEPRPSPSPDG